MCAPGLKAETWGTRQCGRHDDEYKRFGRQVKSRIFGLVAFDIVAMWAISRVDSFALTVTLVARLFLANKTVAFLFRRVSPIRAASPVGRKTMLQIWASWIDYIPVFCGVVCLLVGLFELSWKPCVIGAVAIVAGPWRIRFKGRVREALEDRHRT